MTVHLPRKRCERAVEGEHFLQGAHTLVADVVRIEAECTLGNEGVRRTTQNNHRIRAHVPWKRKERKKERKKEGRKEKGFLEEKKRTGAS